MLGFIQRDGLLVAALLASVGLHLLFFWQPANQKTHFKAPGGQPMAISLNAAPVAKKEISEKLITTQAMNTKSKIIPKKPEPEMIEQQLEQLIVTREVQLSSKPIAPVYPEKARREKQEGLVLVRAQVDHLGKTHEVIVSQSSGFSLLDEAAIKAVSQWSFLPAKENDQAITAWIEVPIDFKLR